jgi:anti-anti-sigma factor
VDEPSALTRPARYGSASLGLDDDGARLTCHIAGEIDLANSGDLFAAVSRAVTAEHEELVLDLGDTTYIDSAGLALLVDINGRLMTRRTRLVLLAGEGSPARRLLAISGIDKVIDVQPEV